MSPFRRAALRKWTHQVMVDAARAAGRAEGLARWSEPPARGVDETSPAAASGFALPSWLGRSAIHSTSNPLHLMFLENVLMRTVRVEMIMRTPRRSSCRV
jgi:hypothetical protein